MVIRKTRLLQVLIDTGASVDILYWDAFKNLHLREEDVSPNFGPIKGFGQNRVLVVGKIKILITMEKGKQATTHQVEFTAGPSLHAQGNDTILFN